MNTSVVTALAALAGAAIGSVSSVIASWLAQYAQARTQRRAQNQVLRQQLYRQFIEESSKLYLHALQNDHADVAALMGRGLWVIRCAARSHGNGKEVATATSIRASSRRRPTGLQPPASFAGRRRRLQPGTRAA